jgi:hypothetical protein
MGEGFDQVALFRRGVGLTRLGRLERRDGTRAPFLIARQVVVRAKDQRNAPIRYRQVRIDLGRLLESTLRLVMVNP